MSARVRRSYSGDSCASASEIAGGTHNAQRAYSSSVDFPVPRPPMSTLYWGDRNTFCFPRNLLAETSMRVMAIDGICGCVCEILECRARHDWRSASAVGFDHFTHVEYEPRVEAS